MRTRQQIAIENYEARGYERLIEHAASPSLLQRAMRLKLKLAAQLNKQVSIMNSNPMTAGR